MMIPFESISDLRTYLFLGRAFVTVVSKVTEKYFTFRVSAHRTRTDMHFVWVKVVNNKYLYLGTIKNRQFLYLTKGSRFNKQSPQCTAFNYLLGIVVHKAYIPPKLGVYHTGRCGRCGRNITTPESLSRGIGPECYNKLTK